MTRTTILFGALSALLLALSTAHADPDLQGDAPVQETHELPRFKNCFVFTLRLDFNNVENFNCLDEQDLLQAAGAQVTLTRDELAYHTSLSGDGVAAALYRVGLGYTVQGIVFGPYLQADGTDQLKTPSSPAKELETIVEGGLVQALVSPFPGEEDFWRIRGGAAQSNSGIDTTTLVGEIIPTNVLAEIGVYHGLNGVPILINFSPEIMLQYDHLNDGPRKYLLFASSYSAVRIGPQLNLSLYPERSLGDFFEQFFISEVIHLSDNSLSGRKYWWNQTSLNYSFPGDIGKHFGLALSYGIGNSEANANQTSQLKIGLTVKN